jgi:hypothetical protein
MEATQNSWDEMSRGSPNQCEVCGANFSDEKAVQRHQNVAHYDRAAPFGARKRRLALDERDGRRTRDRRNGSERLEWNAWESRSTPLEEFEQSSSHPRGESVLVDIDEWGFVRSNRPLHRRLISEEDYQLY